MAKRKIDRKAAEAIDPDKILGVLQGGVEFIGAAEPLIKILFDKIAGWISSAGGPKSPAGRLRRIEALEAKDLLQKELNKVLAAKIKELELLLKKG